MTSSVEDSRRRADEGFTLVELLVVVVVIGILAAIAIPTYHSQREKAYRAEALHDMKNAALAVETFATEHPMNSYAAIDGADQDSPVLRREGFRRSAWVTLLVRADDTSYCIEGENQFVQGKTFVFRSVSGQVDIADTGTIDCA